MIDLGAAGPGLTWTVHDVHGAALGIIEADVGSSVEVDMFGQRRAHIDTFTDTDHAATLCASAAVVLRAWVDQVPLFAGPITKTKVDFPAGTIAVDAIGPRVRLEAFQLGLRSEADPAFARTTEGNYRLDRVAEDEMLARLVEYADPTAAEIADGIPGHGVIRGRLATPRLRDREWEDGKPISEAMDQLAAVIDGPEWDLPAVWDPDRPHVLARLDASETLGRDLTGQMVLECGLGADNAAVTWMPGGDDGGPIINRKRGIGDASYVADGTQNQVIANPEYTVNQRTSEQAYGIWGRTEALSGVSDQNTVVAQTATEVAAHAFPNDHFEATPNLGRVRFVPDGDLWIGDTFTVRAQSGYVAFSADGRVTGAKVEVADAAGNVQVTLRAAPLPTYAVAF